MHVIPPPQPQEALPKRRWFGDRYRFELTAVILALFLFVAATNTQSGWIYVIISIIISATILNIITARLMLHSLQVSRTIPSDIRQGDKALITITLSNHSRWTCLGVTVEEHMPPTLPNILPQESYNVFNVPPHGQASFQYEVPCLLRGSHRFTELRLHCASPFGLFTQHRTIALENWLIVSPIPLDIFQNDEASRENDEERYIRPQRGLGDDYYGLHDYVPDDDLRHIHWKASAHTGQLKVREYHDRSPLRPLCVIIDPKPYPPPDNAQKRLEKQVSLAMALAERAESVHAKLTIAALIAGQVVICDGRLTPYGVFLADVQFDDTPQGIQMLEKWWQESDLAADSTLIWLSSAETKTATKPSWQTDSSTTDDARSQGAIRAGIRSASVPSWLTVATEQPDPDLRWLTGSELSNEAMPSWLNTSAAETQEGPSKNSASMTPTDNMVNWLADPEDTTGAIPGWLGPAEPHIETKPSWQSDYTNASID